MCSRSCWSGAHRAFTHLPKDDPFQSAVEDRPWTRDESALLRETLAGGNTLYNTYRMHHSRPPVGHRGSWTSHDQAVARSRLVLDLAADDHAAPQLPAR